MVNGSEANAQPEGATPPATPAPPNADAAGPAEEKRGRLAAARAKAGFQQIAKSTPRAAPKAAASKTAQRPSGAKRLEESDVGDDEVNVDDIDFDRVFDDDDDEDVATGDSDPSDSSDDSDSSEDCTPFDMPKKRTRAEADPTAGTDNTTRSATQKNREIRKGALRILKQAYPKACRNRYANLQTFCTVVKPEGWVYVALKEGWTARTLRRRAPEEIKETLSGFSRDLPAGMLHLFLSRLHLVVETALLYVHDTAYTPEGIRKLGMRLIRLIKLSGYEAGRVRRNLIESNHSREVANGVEQIEKFNAMQLPSSLLRKSGNHAGQGKGSGGRK
jgi:hypothetical protein